MRNKLTINRIEKTPWFLDNLQHPEQNTLVFPLPWISLAKTLLIKKNIVLFNKICKYNFN